ncbi:MAG TPA: dihydrofolate reductase family protein [Ktedonobacteraceae bacterium]|nr:dihydrofolate reductase family protein [Ktedonobacteraceae bacterium]
MMNSLTPLESLFDAQRGADLSLPSGLAAIYGQLRFPLPSDRPYVFANFVTSLDGVVSLEAPGHAGGGDISGNNTHDHMVMGILRAVADAIIVGAGTLRKSPNHIWSAEHIYPPFSAFYQQLRHNLGKTAPPLNVMVTMEGNINLNQPLFQSGEVPVLILTTMQGEQRLRQQTIPSSTEIVALNQSEKGSLSAQAILEAVQRARPCNLILSEGGPQLLGGFFAEHCLDELFLTLAPQVAGRDETIKRPGLVAGMLFAPEFPLWGSLVSVKRETSHLFLRYSFETAG